MYARSDTEKRLERKQAEKMSKKILTKLLCCPFCGGKALLEYNKSFDLYKVICENEKCAVKPNTEFTKTEESAISKWNTRANDTEKTDCAECKNIITCNLGKQKLYKITGEKCAEFERNY